MRTLRITIAVAAALATAFAATANGQVLRSADSGDIVSVTGNKYVPNPGSDWKYGGTTGVEPPCYLQNPVPLPTLNKGYLSDQESNACQGKVAQLGIVACLQREKF